MASFCSLERFHPAPPGAGTPALRAEARARRRDPLARARGGGFTLLETIFALLVLCIGIAFLATTMGTTIRADANTQAQNSGLFLANQEAEQIVRAFRTFRTPCGTTFTSQLPCGTFVDQLGTTVNLADGGTSSFSTSPLAGYNKTVTIGGPNCVGPSSTVAGCQKYELRWSIVTPVITLNGTQMQTPHQVTVAARAAGGGMQFAPVIIYAATQ